MKERPASSFAHQLSVQAAVSAKKITRKPTLKGEEMEEEE